MEGCHDRGVSMIGSCRYMGCDALEGCHDRGVSMLGSCRYMGCDAMDNAPSYRAATLLAVLLAILLATPPRRHAVSPQML